MSTDLKQGDTVKVNEGYEVKKATTIDHLVKPRDYVVCNVKGYPEQEVQFLACQIMKKSAEIIDLDIRDVEIIEVVEEVIP
jgi:hypothetical protein